MSAGSKTSRYCIIGAGFSGLGVAKAFLDHGIEFDCFEKNEDVGGGVCGSTGYADFKMPADHFKLRGHVRFCATVEEAVPLDPRGLSGWRVRLSTGETRHYTGVIAANGSRLRNNEYGTTQEADTIAWAAGCNVSFPFLDRELFLWENGIPRRVAGMMPEGIAGLYLFGLAQPRGGAGPLITEATKFLSELILAQEKIAHPISCDFARVKKPSARMPGGVTETMRELRLARSLVRRIARRRSGAADLRVAKERTIVNRNMRFDSSADIPKHWFFESSFGTHLANGLNLLFPEGERYFIRSVDAFADKIDDPVLRKRVKEFCGQEVRHGREHERYFETLRKQGFEIDRFMKFYRAVVYGRLEKLYPKKLNLAMTAAYEHYTATFAERSLKDRYFPDHAHPAMSELFMWHAVEEIEHKSVAFDVLQAVAPSYPLRVLGLLMATFHMAIFWQIATFMMIRQDSDTSARRILEELWVAIRGRRFMNGDYSAAFIKYAKPGFHPSQIDNEALADEALRYLSGNAKRGMEFSGGDGFAAHFKA